MVRWIDVGKTLKITKVKSEIGRPEKQRKVLRGMGLNKLNKTVTLADTPQVRGMINKVIHLVSVEESKE
jgi:large subunit ribosomal protein L30